MSSQIEPADFSVAANIAQANGTNAAPVFTDDVQTQGTVVENATVVMNVEGDSLIANGGFESGNLDGWIVEGDPGAVAVEGGAVSGNFQVDVQPTGTGTLLTQNPTIEAGGHYLISFSLQGGSAESTLGVVLGGFEIFTADSASYPHMTPISIELFTGDDFSRVGLTIQGAGAAWHVDDFEVVPLTTEEAIPKAETTSGYLEFTDADIADVHALTVAPRSGSYVGSFDTVLTDSTDIGTGYVDWEFSVDNAIIAFLNDGETLTQTYDVTLDDGHGGTVTRAVTVTIDGSGHVNMGPVAADDTAHIQEDGAGTVTGNVLENDSDPDAGTTLSVTNAGRIQGEFGTLTLAADGGYSYVLDQAAVEHLGQGQVASDTFGYSISDNATSNPLGADAALTIEIEGSNDAPAAGDDVAAVLEDTTLVATGNVLANDSDIDDGATLSVASPGHVAGQYGTLELAADGSYQYVLDNASPAVQGLRAGQSATDMFEYQATDGIDSTVATLTIAIAGANDAPVANTDTASAQEDGGPVVLAAIALLANDTDADAGDTKAIVAVSQAASGAGVALVNGNVVYTPGTQFESLGQGATATDTFTYTMLDGSGAQSSATVIMTVNGVNDAPVLFAPIEDQHAKPGAAFNLTLGAGTFTDVDAGDTLHYGASLANGDALPSWLKFDSATRTFSGTPGAGEAGTLVLKVGATDGAGASAFDEFALTVEAAAGGKTIIGTTCNDNLYGTDLDDTIDGRGGADTMRGGRGNDTYVVDNSGDRVIEIAGEGSDTVRSSISYTLGSNLENLILTGSAALNGNGNTLANLLVGNAGANKLAGGGGNDILQGLGGNDHLTISSGRALLDGGAGNDVLVGGSGNEMFIGGSGNDMITTGSGADIIAFNAGSGQDTVGASTGSDNTLSLGGGIRYSDLKLSRSGNDLVLGTGGADKVTFAGWYSGNKSVGTLQVIAEAMPGFNPDGANPLLDDKVERFSFTALVHAFDASCHFNGWAVTDALLSAHLGGSDSEALGGDLAYQYGANGSLNGIGVAQAQAVVNSSQFGKSAQSLNTPADLQQGQTRLA